MRCSALYTGFVQSCFLGDGQCHVDPCTGVNRYTSTNISLIVIGWLAYAVAIIILIATVVGSACILREGLCMIM